MQIGVDAQRAVENRRVFVVDDDDVTAMALQFMLQDENETHLLPDLAAAQAAPLAPDVLLVGIALLAAHGAPAELKQQCGGARLVAVADREAAAAVDWALAAGADGALWKPLTVETVRRTVDRQLGRRTELHIPVAVR
jgi:DNA-binding NarL/FixJ family response regulator